MVYLCYAHQCVKEKGGNGDNTEVVARRLAEAQAEVETQARQTAEAEIVRLRAELARLRTDTP